jgi:hypothetical protein
MATRDLGLSNATALETDTYPMIRRERRDRESRDRLAHRVLAEFREMPCLRVTIAQAERLFGLREDVGARIIAALVDQGRLRRDEEGRYTTVPLS